MPIVDVKLKPIVNDKKAVNYFWKQVKQSGKPSKKAIDKLKKRMSNI